MRNEQCAMVNALCRTVCDISVFFCVLLKRAAATQKYF